MPVVFLRREIVFSRWKALCCQSIFKPGLDSGIGKTTGLNISYERGFFTFK